jgi:putative transposase of IS4/5 family DUF4096
VPVAAAPWLVSDELWKRVEPLLPKSERRYRYPGRKRLPDRQALQGILFVLYTGIAWRHLPPELGFGGARPVTDGWISGKRPASGSGSTPFCSLSYAPPGRSSGRVRSPTEAMYRRKGGSETGPNPVDRARNGSKHHLLVDATGIPLAWSVTGGNRNDITN